MKKNLILLCVYIFALNLNAINVTKLPRTIIQPDGTKIECFITGDEFGGMIHDANGYALIKDKVDGWWYYAIKDKNENPVCSKFIVGRVNPLEKGLKKGICKFNKEFYDDVSKHRKENIGKFSVSGGVLKSATLTTTGLTQINSLVIFIRFNGSSEFYQNRDYYSPFFNSTTSTSLKDYFSEASYNQLNVNSTFYPLCASSTNLSYVDIYNRSYYISSEYETNGYNNETERTDREHSLLKRAVEAIASQVPSDINIDTNNDGLVDDVCFIVQGGTLDVLHSDLLWPHHWALYSYNVNINGKRVYDYTFLNQSIQFNAETICHEFFHGLGAPDFYRSSNNNPSFEPTGYWGLMGDSHDNFPHMDTYSKNRYGGWIASIPEITQPGTYSLSPITSSSNNCYKIKSPYTSDEYFILEYRKRSGKYESTLEGDGLLVYRIYPNGDNYYGPYDEAYIYRPGGDLTINGTPATANYSSQVGRTSISDITSPSSFLKSGTVGGLKISNIGTSGTTISFNVDFPFSISGPSSVCSSGNTFTITNLPPTVNSIEWIPGPGLTITYGQYSSSCTFSATGNINSWVKATLVTNYGRFTLSQKNVTGGVTASFTGNASVNYGGSGTWNATASGCTSPYHYEWWLREDTTPPVGAILVGEGNSLTLWSVPRSGLAGSTEQGLSDQEMLQPPTSTNYYLSLQAFDANGMMYNTQERLIVAYGDVDLINPMARMAFAKTGETTATQMKISPNPASDEATVELFATEAQRLESSEWQLEIYDATQLLKTKIKKINGRKQTIQTTGWKEGVYIIRAKVGNELLTDKLVIKP